MPFRSHNNTLIDPCQWVLLGLAVPNLHHQNQICLLRFTQFGCPRSQLPLFLAYRFLGVVRKAKDIQPHIEKILDREAEGDRWCTNKVPSSSRSINDLPRYVVEPICRTMSNCQRHQCCTNSRSHAVLFWLDGLIGSEREWENAAKVSCHSVSIDYLNH